MLDGLRRLAACKGGAWSGLLAAMPPEASSSSLEQPQQQQVEKPKGANDAKGQKEQQDAEMGVPSQNALVLAPKPAEASPDAGATLALVPGLAKRQQGASAAAQANKLQRRG